MKLGTTFVAALVLTAIIIPLLSAATISTDSLGITVKYVEKIENSSGTFYNLTVKFDSDEYNGNDKFYSFVVNALNLSNRNYITLLDKDFSYLFVADSGTGISVNLNASDALNLTRCNQDLLKCQSSINGYSYSYNVCAAQLGNQTKTNNLLNSYNASLIQKSIELSSKDKEITDLKTQSSDSKNAKWLYVIIALAVGAFGMNWYRNSKGGGTVREKSMGEFNPNQMG